MQVAALSSGQLYLIAEQMVEKLDKMLAQKLASKQVGINLREMFDCLSRWRAILRLAGAGIGGRSLSIDLVCEVDDALEDPEIVASLAS